MPLVKHHDTLTDLIRKGAEKKQSLHNERRRQSAYYAGWDIDDPPESIAYAEDGSPIVDPGEKDKILRCSALFLWLIEMHLIKFSRLVALIGAFVILTVDASTDPESVAGLLDIIYPLEYAVNIYYILDGGMKMASMYCYIAISRNCSQSLTQTTYLRRSGVVDIPLSLLCLIYRDDKDVNQWLHLIRCMTLSFFFLEQTPQIDVLMSGITAGLRSTLYTWSLMILIFLVFAAAGVIFFRDNDPYHFGNVGMAMWTYFEMTTLDNWSDVLRVNYLGCDEYSADYYEQGDGFKIISTDYGSFYLPVCGNPSKKPLASSILFTLFILMSGFVMVSLTVAFVTTGINNKLRALKEEEDQLELLLEQGRAPEKTGASGARKPRRPSVVQTALRQSQKSIKRTMASFDRSSPADPSIVQHISSRDSCENNDQDEACGVHSIKRSLSSLSADSNDSNGKKKKRVVKSTVPDTELLRALLLQVWKAEDGEKGGILKDESLSPNNLQRRKGVLSNSKNVGNFNAASFKRAMKDIKGSGKQATRSDITKMFMRVGVYMRQIVANRYYVYAVSIIIVIAAAVQLLTTEGRIDPVAAEVIGVLCQVAFTFDLMFKFMSNSPKYLNFFDISWNVFDSVLIFLLWIPILAVGAPNIVYFELLKILRIIRVLKIFSWIAEVNVIMKSISTSARCLSYVVFLMIVFFYHFGVAGVYLFSRNDPFHFGNIGKALLTLFQISTLDDWSDIARMNMYGCMHIGYDPDHCDEHDSYGWGWIAAWYFIVFVIVGVMVLVALFVGVIITSMELLQLSISEEAEMLKKVAAKQSEFGITDACAHTLLEIFDMIDVCANGKLTLHELKPILGMVSLKDSQQYELFHKIDEDMSGKIDFAEFVELIHLLNLAFLQKTNAMVIPQKSSTSLKRFLQPQESGQSSIMAMLTSGFRTKKSIKSVAKMSILAARLSKSQKENNMLTSAAGVAVDENRCPVSRVLEVSENTNATSSKPSSPKKQSSKWGALLASVKKTDSNAALDMTPVDAAANPESDPSPSAHGLWFGSRSAAVVPDNQTQDIIPFIAPPSDSASPVRNTSSTDPTVALSQRYNGTFDDMSVGSVGDYELERYNSDERYDEVPTGDKFRNKSGPYYKGVTFSAGDSSKYLAEDSHSAPQQGQGQQQRPSTQETSRVNISSLEHTNGGLRYFASSPKVKFSTSDNVPSPMSVSPNGSPTSKRFKKRMKVTLKHRPYAVAEKEPNLFFNYAGNEEVTGRFAQSSSSAIRTFGSSDGTVHL